MDVSKEAARQFLVSRQGFHEDIQGKKGTLKAIIQLECVQFILSC